MFILNIQILIPQTTIFLLFVEINKFRINYLFLSIIELGIIQKYVQKLSTFFNFLCQKSTFFIILSPTNVGSATNIYSQLY